MLLLIKIYMVLSAIVYMDYMHRLKSFCDYVSSIPVGDLEYYKLEEPNTIVLKLFFPAYIGVCLRSIIVYLLS